jgi:Predicted membrane protein
MGIAELLILAIGLSMDAFSVSICQGLCTNKFSYRTALLCGLWFGGFQALMPVIGYFLGIQFESFIVSIDHWIAFGLLVLIGSNMIREAFLPDDKESNCSLNPKNMFVLAVATSIDALAVGITFAFLQVNIWLAVLIIGLTTFAFSAIGSKIGNTFGSNYQSKAEITGGVILILIGLKIFLEHLGIISF